MAYLTQTQSGQPVLILKEGTSRSRGKEAQRNNIMAARVIGEVLKTTLGPRGMDKMLFLWASFPLRRHHNNKRRRSNPRRNGR